MLKRRISRSVATRSISIAFLAALLVITDTMLLSVFERSGLKDHLFSTLDLLFESVSAFGTVGLSSANTPVLHPNSHIVLIITMYIGRVGPASLALAFAGRKLSANEKIYPEAKVLVG
jgi:trk system potassium uptake protein TrkH